jgi:hypothetical protein
MSAAVTAMPQCVCRYGRDLTADDWLLRQTVPSRLVMTCIELKHCITSSDSESSKKPVLYWRLDAYLITVCELNQTEPWLTGAIVFAETRHYFLTAALRTSATKLRRWFKNFFHSTSLRTVRSTFLKWSPSWKISVPGHRKFVEFAKKNARWLFGIRVQRSGVVNLNAEWRNVVVTVVRARKHGRWYHLAGPLYQI